MTTPHGEAVVEKLRRYSKPANDGSGCRIWVRGTYGPGYGHIHMGPGKRVGAHRVALEIKLGRPIQVGLFVLHSCDNPRCVNPEHLREGSELENKHDAVSRNRTAYGERNASAKLTPRKVVAIRADCRSNSALARAFGVDRKTIRQIKRREIWVRVGN